MPQPRRPSARRAGRLVTGIHVSDCERRARGGKKIYSLHAQEVECIGTGKAHRPHEFDVKAPIATTLHRLKGGHFVADVVRLPGNPYDGHTLESVIPADSDEAGHASQYDAGHLFRSDAGRHSDLMSATRRAPPQIEQ